MSKLLILLTALLHIPNTMASPELVDKHLISSINDNWHSKTVIRAGDTIIFMNHTIDEFKDEMLTITSSKKHSSDSFYRALGMNTSSQTEFQNLKKYFSRLNFDKVKNSPAFSMIKIGVIYLDTFGIEDDDDFNVYGHYNNLHNKTQDLLLSINNTNTSDPYNEDLFSDYLDNLPSNELLSLSSDEIVGNFESTLPKPMPSVNVTNLEHDLLKTREKISVINQVFVDWHWFLQPKLYQPIISLKEISLLNMDLDWIYLHELSHLTRDQNPILDLSFRSKIETALLKEIHSDIFAALMLDYDDKVDIYKKIDSIIYTRILKKTDIRHFTVAPLMALKILMSTPGFSDLFTSYENKKKILNMILTASKRYLKDILSIAKKLSSGNQEELANDMKKVVRLMLVYILKIKSDQINNDLEF